MNIPFEEIPRHRVRLLRCTNELLAHMFSLDWSKLIKIEGLPADARIVGVSDQLFFNSNEVAFKVESEEFAFVESGNAIPELHLNCSVSTPEYNWGKEPEKADAPAVREGG